MICILMEQTQLERSRITPAFKALVYDAFKKQRRRDSVSYLTAGCPPRK